MLKMITCVAFACAAHAVLAADAAVPPAPTTVINVAAVDPALYFGNPDFRSVRMSPSGKYLAALVPATGGRLGLAVMSLETRDPHIITVIDGYDLFNCEWVNDNRLVYSVWDMQAGLGDQKGGGLFVVDRDGSNTRMIAPTVKQQIDGGQMRGRSTQLLTTLRDGSDDMLIEVNDLNEKYADVYRVNTVTGRRTLESLGRPGDVVSWVADPAGRLRGAVTDENTLVTKSWWRPPGSDKWEMIGQYGMRDTRIVPVAFEPDGSMIVASNMGRDTFALYRWDAVKKAPGEELAAYPRADFEGEGLVYDRRKQKYVGLHYDVERAGTAWFDDDWARVQATVDKALPDTANMISRADNGVYLVAAASDTRTPEWYLLDPAKGKLEFLGAARKNLAGVKMPPRKAVRYRARDGLEIPAFLTLPLGREPRNLPLVMLVHGGPNVRGTSWEWNPEAAYLAALGYAVLEPEFRGSMGWGKKLFEAGWKQWGRAMQDDLNDGMDWLAQQGTIDPKRACIMGASYGGYAVMEGLARDPDRWRCGINYVGVTDIDLMFTVTWSDFSDSDYLKYAAKDVIGDPDKDAAMLKAVSPLAHASAIKAPVLMAYGGADVRVPVIHGEQMRDALKANGTPVEFTVYPGEGHGFLLKKNLYDFYANVAVFLGRYLPASP